MNEIIHVPFFSKEECLECIEYAHNKEIELKNFKDFKDTHEYGKNRVTTNLYKQYNFFNDNPKYIPRLKKIIHTNIGNKIEYPLIVQSWINIYRTNEDIKWHRHTIDSNIMNSINGYTSNIFVGGDENIGLTYAIHDEENPRYYYKNIKNKLGHMMIFPNHIFHMVKKNSTNNIRYSIGMTITSYNPITIKNILNSEKKYSKDILFIKSPTKNNILFYS